MLLRLSSILLLIACQGCAIIGAGSGVTNIQAGERPDIATDEAGLWMINDKLEKKLASSGRVENDVALNQYLRDIVCRLSAEYCRDIRIYIVRTPYFNASMAPNGTLQVWTGLLLRVENEAQLAYILGHELGHYLRRHTVQQWRDHKTKANVMLFFSIATAAAKVGYIGSLARLAVIGSILAFSREQEREADDIGFNMMAKAGYDTGEAARIWQALERERDAADESEAFVFFSSHPVTEERIQTLKKRASAMSASAASDYTGQSTYLDMIDRFRFQWLRDDLRNRKLARSEVLLDRLLDIGHDPSEVYYFKGELYRLRAEEGDLERAVAAYRVALSLHGVVPQAHRSIGLVYLKQGELALAREAFKTYLRLVPEAQDHEMVKSYLKQI